MRRTSTALLASILGLACGLFLLWHWAENRLSQGYAGFQAACTAAGLHLATDAPRRGGWPLAATLILPHPVLQADDAVLPGGLRWSADGIVLRISIFAPATLAVQPQGAMRLRLAGLPEWQEQAARFSATMPLPASGPAHVLNVLAKTVMLAPSADPAAGAVSAADLTMHLDWAPQAGAPARPALAIGLRSEVVGMPSDRAWAFGPRLSSVSVDARIDGALPPGASLPARLAAWQAAGGAVTAQRVSLGWGPLGLTGSATLGLDQQLQLTGAATLQILGYADALDALARAGAIRPQAAMAAKAMLALMGRPPEGGGVPRVELPATLQDGTLSVAGIPVARAVLPAWLTGAERPLNGSP